MMKLKLLAASLIAAVAVSGCGPDGPTKADTGTLVGAVAGGILGNQVGNGTGRVLATAAGAFVGGIVGHSIGQSLDEQDRRYAQTAEYSALEKGESGRPVSWRNPDSGHYGEVVPRESYNRGGRPCRNFEHTVYIGGRPETMRGRACRNADGTWTNVS
ncbi:MAG: RT0821/Lpp0805 family surface protein [Pseudomonadota bacterium]